MESKKVNIKEIAQMAGVSVSAVSRYLNQGYVSEEKKNAIAQAIEKTGYVPSKQAQILRTRKTKIIGVIVPRISSEAVARVVDGIGTAISGTDYQILFANTANNVKKEAEYLALFDKNPVDGIILIATMFTKQHRQILKKLSVPIVIIGQRFEGYASIYHDDFGAACELTGRLLDAGCERVGCIAVTQEDRAAGYARVQGFQKAFQLRQKEFDQNLYIESDFDLESGYRCMGELLKRDGKLDGVFCATDVIAIGAMQKLKEKNRKVGKEVQIVGIGHDRMSRVVEPRLTTAHLYYKNSGMESVKLLMEMIQSQEMISKQIELGYEIVDGQSVVSSSKD